MAAQTFEEVMKFNPYHDARGRFASATGYATFTIRTKDPKKQHMADMAISRMKQKEQSDDAKGKSYINGLQLQNTMLDAHKADFNNLSKEEQNAIKRYMSSTGITASYKNKGLVDQAISRSELPVNATLTRGVTDLPTTMDEAKSMIGQSIGTTIPGKPISTSIKPDQNWGTATIVIRADKGTKGMYVEAARQSKKADQARAKAAKEGKVSGEAEFLLPSTTKIKITGIRMGSHKGQDKIIYDAVIDNQVGKSATIAKTFSDILKFNPYHDSRGRFAQASSAATFTYKPGASAAHDNAIAREKERHSATAAPKTTSNKPKELKTDKEYDEFASHYKEWEKSLSEEEKAAVGRYQNESFGFNEKLRHGSYDGGYGGEQATDKEYAALDAALSKSTIHQSVVVHRAISDADALGDLNKLVGKTITDKGYASTSLSRSAAEDYGEGIICKINVPKGSKAAYISNVTDSKGKDFSDNREILLPRDSHYKVKAVVKKEEPVYFGGKFAYNATKWEVEMDYEG